MTNRNDNNKDVSSQAMPATVATVDFHGKKLIIIEVDGKPYTAMKPIVEGMGLAWQVQHRKITKSGGYNHMVIPFQTLGGLQEMFCIPLKKLNGWLFSVNPRKVKTEIRSAVKLYQEECFTVLYDYWHKGVAFNPRAETGITFSADMEAFAASVQRMLYRAQKEQERQLADHDRRISAVESEVDRNSAKTGFFTVRAFCNLHDIKIGLNDAKAKGRKAAKLSKQMELTVYKSVDELYGKVNSYHEDVLAEVFSDLVLV